MAISVYLVDDHEPFRRCLRQLLVAQPDIDVVGEAPDGEVALAAAARCAPVPLAQVVLLDVALPGAGGVEVARELTRMAPAGRIVALSLHDEPAFVAAMQAAGATAYIRKDEPLPRLLAALHEAAAPVPPDAVGA